MLIGVGLGAYLLWRLHEVLLLFFLAILLATAIEPVVNRLRRGPFTKGSGTLVVYAAIILAVGLPAYLAIPPAINQGTAFFESLPARVQGFRPVAENLEPRMLGDLAVTVLDRVNYQVQTAEPPAGEDLAKAGATAAHTVISFVTVFVLAFYWIVERATIKRVLLRSVRRKWALEINTVWVEVEEKLGGWVRGQIILMLSIGVMAGVGYWILGLPNPILLAVLAAFGEIIPLIGPFISVAPAILIALTLDPTKAIVVIIYAIIIQQIENNILVPRVMGHTVGISPLTVLLGILAGAALYGIPGAFLAVPIAGAIQVILAHVLRTEDPAQEEAHPPPHDDREAPALDPALEDRDLDPRPVPPTPAIRPDATAH